MIAVSNVYVPVVSAPLTTAAYGQGGGL